MIRFTAKSIAMEQSYNVKINDLDIEKRLGPEKFDFEKELVEREEPWFAFEDGDKDILKEV